MKRRTIRSHRNLMPGAQIKSPTNATNNNGHAIQVRPTGHAYLTRMGSQEVTTVNSRLVVPAQTVDATPSDPLIRQHFPGATDPFGCTRSKPSQGGIPTDLTLASDFSVCFQGFVDSSGVLHRPTETTRIIGNLKSAWMVNGVNRELV